MTKKICLSSPTNGSSTSDSDVGATLSDTLSLSYSQLEWLAEQHGLKTQTVYMRYRRGVRGEKLVAPRDPRGLKSR